VTIKEEVILKQASYAVRDQGRRPTCIAFALVETNLPFAADVKALSPEYLYQAAACLAPAWVPGSGVTLDLALRAAALGQPVESDFPYQVAEPIPPVLAPPSSLNLYGGPIDLVPLEIESICQMVRERRPVGLGLKLTRSFYQPVDGVITFARERIEPVVLHAVAAVGLGWDQEEPYFLIRNSWGAGWGVEGSAWLPGTFVRQHAICAFGG
jgi:hypothetical protein